MAVPYASIPPPTAWAFDQDLAGTAHERAINFALGWHLKPLLERRLNLDCEYNRATDQNGKVDVKRLHESQPIIPDL